MNFILKDSTGTEHQYQLALHPSSEGYKLTMAFVALGLPALAVGVGAITGTSEDSSTVGEMGDRIAQAIMAMPDGMVEDILKYTLRDAQPLNTGDPVGKVTFDRAYQGNYLELFAAVQEVATRNGFFVLPSDGPIAQMMNVVKEGIQGLFNASGNEPPKEGSTSGS